MNRNAASNPQLLPVQALTESRARAEALAASLQHTQTSVQRLEQELTRGEQQREERQHTSAQVWACCRVAWAAHVLCRVQPALSQPLQRAAARFSWGRAMSKGVWKEAVFVEPTEPRLANQRSLYQQDAAKLGRLSQLTTQSASLVEQLLSAH